MFGNGISGVAMNGLRAILQVILPGKENQYTMALIFFICATGILLLCGYLFTPLYKAKIFLHYHKSTEMNLNADN